MFFDWEKKFLAVELSQRLEAFLKIAGSIGLNSCGGRLVSLIGVYLDSSETSFTLLQSKWSRTEQGLKDLVRSKRLEFLQDSRIDAFELILYIVGLGIWKKVND